MTFEMTVNTIRSAVEQHYCHVEGVRYGCVLKWVAVERDCHPTTARYLLNIEFVSTPGGLRPAAGLHMLVRVAELASLAELLNDALFHYLAEQTSTGASDGRCVSPGTWQAAYPPEGARPN